MCACSAPDSFQSLTISLNLNIRFDPYSERLPFHGVITRFELGRVQQYSQNLGIELGGPLCSDQPDNEEQNPTCEAVHEVEDSGSRKQSDKKQAPLRSQNRQWTIHHLVDPVSAHGGLSGEKPRHEIHSAHGHADAEHDAGEDLFRLALAKGKHQSADHDCHQTQSGGNRAGERRFESVYLVFPWRSAALRVASQKARHLRRLTMWTLRFT